jgi:four helix bundle protein
MNETANSKPYDLADRTFLFTKQVVALTKVLPRTIANIEFVKQLIRSAGSVGANYIEANEALSKKDFTMRIKICRKESKESHYWLRLLEGKGDEFDLARDALVKEAIELTKIFNAIIDKSK